MNQGRRAWTYSEHGDADHHAGILLRCQRVVDRAEVAFGLAAARGRLHCDLLGRHFWRKMMMRLSDVEVDARLVGRSSSDVDDNDGRRSKIEEQWSIRYS